MRQTKSKKYSDVKIEFMKSDHDISEIATIIRRTDEMVLDIADDSGSTVYLVVGKSRGHYYSGVNSAFGDVPRVNATWTELGGKYIGFWIEDGDEYLFSFRLAAD